MPTEARTFWMPKDAAYEDEYEDAFALDESRRVAAIADGVSSAIFSRLWARLLTDGIVADTPDPSAASFWDWLAARRQAWADGIDFSKVNIFQRAKLQQVGGAFTTLLWLTWDDDGDGVHWRAFATGDSGLLHVRAGETLMTFPVTTLEELAADPLTICSVNQGRDGQIEFRSECGRAEPGDLLVLVTDALLGWALAEADAGRAVDWAGFWDVSDDEFRGRVQALRDERAIRVDDTTLVLLRVTPVPSPERERRGEESDHPSLALRAMEDHDHDR